MQVELIVKMLAEFGGFFWSKDGVRTKDSFRTLSSNWREAFMVFLEDYAFARQGSSPHYPQAAAIAVKEYPSKTPDDDFEQIVWQEFLKQIGAPASGKGANVQNNPLAPSFGNKISITALVSRLCDHDYNLVRWAKDGLRKQHVSEISGTLRGVRGLGSKITSLFLRDVATAFEMDELQLEPAKYLQPIDRWTRRGTEALAMLMRSPHPKGEEECAIIIVKASIKAGVCPSLVNAGLWVLGAWFAQTEAKFKDVLVNLDRLCQFLDEQRNNYIAKVKLLDKVMRSYRL
jgi:hypothetical protein